MISAKKKTRTDECNVNRQQPEEENISIEEFFENLRCSRESLSTEAARQRLELFGHKKLEEEEDKISAFAEKKNGYEAVDLKNISIEEFFENLRCSRESLSTEAARQRLELFGHKKLEEEEDKISYLDPLLYFQSSGTFEL